MEEEVYHPHTILDKFLEATKIVKCGTRSVHYIGIIFVAVLSIYVVMATLLCLGNLMPAVYLEYSLAISIPTIVIGFYVLYGFVYNFYKCIVEHPGPVYFDR